jgi:predicted acyltransferase
MSGDETAPESSARIESLDQFRGYTVAGMFLVNGLSRFAVVPAILKHHNTYCSFADTIMPQFFFAVGFAARLTLLRRLERSGPRAAYGHALARVVGLLLLGFVVYHFDGGAKTWSDLKALGLSGFLQRAFLGEYFQTLVHIAVTSAWVLPVIAARPGIRLVWLVGSAAAHFGLSHWWYYGWVTTHRNIDGGPLGFLTWTIPVLVGSFAFDIVAARRPGVTVRLLLIGALLMLLGYGLTCADGQPDALPFFPPIGPFNGLTMSQRAGTVSYQTFAAGFSMAVYGLFFLASDVGRLRVGVFRTLGRNALAAYLLHPMVAEAMEPYLPKDSPAWFVAIGFAAEFGLTYLFLRYLEKNKLFLRL